MNRIMNRQNVPAPALSKLLELGAEAEFLSDKVINIEKGIASARQRLTGGMKQTDYDDLRTTLQTMVDDLPVLKRRCDTAQAIYTRCRAFIDALPDGTVLEPVKPNCDGHDLASVRTLRKAKEEERKALRALPTSSADIEQRIRADVEGLARPTISGIGKGEKLRITWPGCGWDSSGPRTDRAELLPMMALLFPDAMVNALMREIERMTNGVVPIKERVARIAALEREILQLAYIEETLVTDAIADGEDVQRSPSAPPQTVLGVRVRDETSYARA
jgi:hypothetical protein